MLLAAVVAFSVPRAHGEAPVPAVVVLTISGAVQPASLRYLERGLEEAARQEASLVILELDTPGGLWVSTREMVSALTRSGPPVAVHVAPAGAHAVSAGFFLLLAADVVALAPGTTTGAAHPVPAGGAGRGDEANDALRASLAKITNDAASLARSLAAQRGRPERAAAAAVLESTAWGAQEALDAGLADLVVSDREALLAALDGREIRRFDGRVARLALEGAEVRTVSLTWADRLLHVIADPSVAYLLLLLGVLGLTVELFTPGLGLPGVLGATSFLLALYAFTVLPVNAVGVALVAAAVAFFVAEIFTPTFGAMTAAGLLSLALGMLLLVESAGPLARPPVWSWAPALVLVMGVTGFLSWRGLRARRQPPLAGLEEMVGELGVACGPLDHVGRVLVHGEYWEAESPVPVQRGARVRVRAVRGRRLDVEPAET